VDLVLDRVVTVRHKGELVGVLHHIVVLVLRWHLRLGGVVLALLVERHYMATVRSLGLGSGRTTVGEAADIPQDGDIL